MRGDESWGAVGKTKKHKYFCSDAPAAGGGWWGALPDSLVGSSTESQTPTVIIAVTRRPLLRLPIRGGILQGRNCIADVRNGIQNSARSHRFRM